MATPPGTLGVSPSERPPIRFEGSVAFVTGGGAGFGQAFAAALVAGGAAVVVADVDAIATLGGIDNCTNNAGLHLSKYNEPFGALPRTDLRSLFEVNVIGVVNCSLACRPSMRGRGGGAFCNIASIAAHLTSTPYGVSKLAVRGLTVALAHEFADDGIRVNAISPGLVATENAIADLPEKFVREFRDEKQLVHRTGAVSEIVDAVLFLCSDADSLVTGETLKVSGGQPCGM